MDNENIEQVIRPVQELFNLAIEKNYYLPYTRANCFMCNAISRMEADRLITEYERDSALYAIELYMDGLKYKYLSAYNLDKTGVMITLKTVLSFANLPSSDTDCLAIYQDWENRPR